MRFSRLLLLQVLLFVLSSTTCASTANPSRLLRGAEPFNDEDRGFFGNLKAGIKTAWWSRTGKSEAYVKGKLGLTGLDDAALKANKNYRVYKLFQYKAEGRKMKKWVYEDNDTPSKVWKRFKLDQMDPTQRDKSPELDAFSHFVKKYDDATYRHENFQYKFTMPKTEPERDVYTRIWGLTDRPESYVKSVLKIDDGDDDLDVITHAVVTTYKSENEIKSHDNYKYLESYRKWREAYKSW